MEGDFERPKMGGGTELENILWKYRDYLIAELQKKFDAEGRSKQLRQYALRIESFKSIEKLDRFAEKQGIAKFEFKT